MQMPLSCYLSGFFLWLFGDGLFTFRVLTAVLFALTALLMWYLCSELTQDTGLALAGTTYTMGIHLCFFIYNYNYLTALFLLIVLLLEMKAEEGPRKHIAVGLLVGCALVNKQNTGLFIWLANVIICWRGFTKGHICKRDALLRVAASILPILVYFIYMVWAGILPDFIEYAVLGIATFSHRYTPLQLLQDDVLFGPCFLLIIVMLGMMGIKSIREDLPHFQFSAFLFSMAWTSVMYPLADASHVILVFIPLIPAFLSCFQLRSPKFKQIIYGIAVVVCMVFSVYIVDWAAGIQFHVSDLPNYSGVLFAEQYERQVKSVGAYIDEKEAEGYRVLIADKSAAAYMIPQDKYEKNWDMLLVGNLGLSTVQKLLETDQPTIYLVYRENPTYGLQDHYELIDYIRENYTILETVDVFDAYFEQG